MKLQRLLEAKYENNIDLSNDGLLKLPDDLPDTISGNFYCYNNKLTSLKFCPSEVGGKFDCADNKLKSLEHCPSVAGDDFSCGYNRLTSLNFCPSEVVGDFYCSYNNLTSLNFCPSEVVGDFYCHRNKLTSLEDIHKQIKKIGGDFYCHDNKIKSHILGLMLIDIGGEIITHLGNGKDVDEILNRWKNQGRKGVLGVQHELLDLGYEELAQL